MGPPYGVISLLLRWKPLVAIVLAFCASAASGPARAAEPVIRVQIIATLDRILIKPAGPWNVRASKAWKMSGRSEAAPEPAGARLRMRILS